MTDKKESKHSKRNSRGKHKSKLVCQVSGKVDDEDGDRVCFHKTRRGSHEVLKYYVDKCMHMQMINGKYKVIKHDEYYISDWHKCLTQSFHAPKIPEGSGHEYHIMIQCPGGGVREQNGRVKPISCVYALLLSNYTQFLSLKTRTKAENVIKKHLHKIGYLVYCPRSGCVAAEKGTKLDKHISQFDPSIWTCQERDIKERPCGADFCINCGMYPYHYGTGCDIAAKIRGYANNLRSTNKETVESAIAILRDTQLCPKCATAIYKMIGCDHITCSECMTHFCWKCIKTLDKKNVYGDHIVYYHMDWVCKDRIKFKGTDEEFFSKCKVQNLTKLYGDTISKEHITLIMKPIDS
jgi:hypothetical protein